MKPKLKLIKTKNEIACEDFKPFLRVNIKSGIIMLDRRAESWNDDYLSGKISHWGPRKITAK